MTLPPSLIMSWLVSLCQGQPKSAFMHELKGPAHPWSLAGHPGVCTPQRHFCSSLFQLKVQKLVRVLRVNYHSSMQVRRMY